MSTKKEFEAKVMQEVGLEVDTNGNVVDQDTGVQFYFKNKPVKAENVDRDSILFDPLNNQNMMSKIFSYHTEKLHQEEGRYVGIYYSSGDRGEKSHIELKEGEGVIKSGSYYNDSIKLADLIMGLNGNKKVDFSDLDGEVRRGN